MNLYESVKAAVTARQAAERCGLAVSPGGMANCPFHDDEHPSLKLDERYFCFGCGAQGDAVDFTARFFNLTPKDAALRLAADFGVPITEHAAKGASRPEAPFSCPDPAGGRGHPDAAAVSPPSAPLAQRVRAPHDDRAVASALRRGSAAAGARGVSARHAARCRQKRTCRPSDGLREGDQCN